MSHCIGTGAGICNAAAALPAASACDAAFLCAYRQLRILRCRDRNLNRSYREKALCGIPRQLCPYIVAVCEVLHAFVDVRQIDGFRTDRACRFPVLPQPHCPLIRQRSRVCNIIKSHSLLYQAVLFHAGFAVDHVSGFHEIVRSGHVLDHKSGIVIVRLIYRKTDFVISAAVLSLSQRYNSSCN